MPRLQINESARTAGTGLKRRARIIEGDRWGSSAYYPREVLERDGPRVFTAGTQMFEDHLSENERWDRPEGSVGKLVGKLISDAIYEDDGLYADVEFYESYGPRINEIGDDIGLSVRASGLTEDAEMDGRYGPVLVAFLSADSVDVVTRAGAGGKLTSILESDRELAGQPIDKKEGTSVTDVTKADFEGFKTELIEAIANLGTSLKESLAGVTPEVTPEVEEPKVDEEPKDEPVVIDHAAVVEAVRTHNLPTPAIAAIVEALTKRVSLEDAVKAQVELREAFVSTAAESGVVTFKESKDGQKSGLARSIEILEARR
jgi:hypothetical protein